MSSRVTIGSTSAKYTDAGSVGIPFLGLSFVVCARR